MKNEIRIFENEEFGSVRTIVKNGEPWFVGKDVTSILGYERTTKAIVDRVDDEDRKMIDSKTQSQIGIEIGQRGGWLINESGLYSLILSSKLSAAKKFKHWVTSEVLPALRKNGSYSIQEKPDSYMIDNPVERAKRWIEEYEERLALEEKIKRDEPLVAFADKVSNVSNAIDISALAKLLNDENIPIGRNRLFKWLRDNKYIRPNNEPYQKYINDGIFDLVECTYRTPYGEKAATKTVVTGKGQIYITEKLRKYYGEHKNIMTESGDCNVEE